jgi:hypothetical protein
MKHGRAGVAGILGGFCLAAAASAQPAGTSSAPPRDAEPSNAARILARNYVRGPGWFLHDGVWVRPSASIDWPDLITLRTPPQSLAIEVRLSDKAEPLLRQNRTAVVWIESDGGVGWAVSTPGRVWDDNRAVASPSLSASRLIETDLKSPSLARLSVVGVDARNDAIRVTARGLALAAAGEERVHVELVQVGFGPPEHANAARAQPAVGVTVNDADGRQLARADARDWAELLKAQPELTRTYVAPVLRQFCPTGANPLAPRAGDLASLFPDLPADPAAVTALATLLPELSHPDAKRREQASRDLETLGDRGVIAAARLNRAALPPEAAARLKSFVYAHTLYDPTVTPDLRTNADVLLDCLDHDDAAVRAAAKTALEAALGRTVAYEPNAPRAARLRQLDTLRRNVHTDGR